MNKKKLSAVKFYDYCIRLYIFMFECERAILNLYKPRSSLEICRKKGRECLVCLSSLCWIKSVSFFRCDVEINLTTGFFGAQPGRTFCICLLLFVSFSVTFQLSLKSVPLLAPRNRCPIRRVASKSNYTVTVEKRRAFHNARLNMKKNIRLNSKFLRRHYDIS